VAGRERVRGREEEANWREGIQGEAKE